VSRPTAPAEPAGGAGGEAPATIRLGLIAAPGPSTELAHQLAEDLPEVLQRRVSGDVEWSIPVVTDSLAADPASGAIAMIDDARDRMLEEGWDFAIALTDQPLRIGRRPVVADVSATHGIGLISLPALGAVQVRRRARDAVARLVEGLLAESLELGAPRAGSARRRRMTRRLADLAAPVRAVLPDDDQIDLRYVAAVVRGNVRLIAGMVRANRPWRLIVGLSRALAAALAAVVFALVTSDVSKIADAAAWWRLLAIAVISVTVTVVTLIVAHELWDRATDERARQRVVLFNVATALTVTLGILVLYVSLFALSLLGAWLMLQPSRLAQQLGHPVDFADYARLAWFVASLATVGGALGAALESDVAVRQAAYGYRPDEESGESAD
jgi:chromate transport protein ChrA